MIEAAAAAVIAGGAGRRLGGVDKALLEVGGEPILARQLSRLRPLFAELLLVANDPAPFAGFGVRVVPDLFAGKGAPGGVQAALAAAAAPWVFCLGCDMPFPSPAAIELLAARREGTLAVAPLREGRPEPLFAFYSRALAAPFAAALASGDPSLGGLLTAARARFVGQADFERADPGCRSLENLNLPSDLIRLGCSEPHSPALATPAAPRR